ncbi:MAG: hypothetical protein QW279_09595, partial [Candidatus Jordarchaeaceae archaeon]
QMINMIVIIGLFYGMWQVLGSYLLGKTVAYAPFYIPMLTVGDGPLYEIPLFFWYLICSFLTNTLLQRAFGLGTGLSPQTQLKK